LIAKNVGLVGGKIISPKVSFDDDGKNWLSPEDNLSEVLKMSSLLMAKVESRR
jgi:beta-xylosidase